MLDIKKLRVPLYGRLPGGFGFHRFFSLFYISMKIPEKDSRNYFMAGSQERYTYMLISTDRGIERRVLLPLYHFFYFRKTKIKKKSAHVWVPSLTLATVIFS